MTRLIDRPAAEQNELRNFGQHFGVQEETLASFPTVPQLCKAYRETAQELSSSADPYDNNRAKDLTALFNVMSRDLSIYRHAMAALVTFRLNANGIGGVKVPLVEKSKGTWEYTRHYKMIEPRDGVLLLEGSALGDAHPDTDRDNKIAERIFAKLPEECRTPLYVGSSPK